jgi:hypothetical protein
LPSSLHRLRLKFQRATYKYFSKYSKSSARLETNGLFVTSKKFLTIALKQCAAC